MAALIKSLELLVEEARWLDAADKLDDFEEATESAAACTEATHQMLIDNVRDMGGKFRAARAQCANDEIDWEPGYSYLGIETSFRYDDRGQLWLKTEGAMNDVNIYYTVAVIREVELFGEWVPFMRTVSKLAQVDFSRLCTHFSVGIRGVLVRDCVLRVSACNSALSEGALYFEGASPADDIESLYGAPLPPRCRSFASDRMSVTALHARIEFAAPDAQRCKVVAAVDLRLSLPRVLLDFTLKHLVGVFLVLWRRQARRVARDADCEHRRAIEADGAFYRDFLDVKYAEFLEARGWHPA